ncbi:MAG: sodium-dependent bicarbonate transport family permease [Verrucomicrobiales bacterium]|nr:sodium-dependent bicarbonate transport family permease [Verrucomicrobiales bacterium]
MELIFDFLRQFASQLQSPTLSFLIGGALLAAFGSKLTIPSPIYQFVVFVLLMKIGMKGGVEIRGAELSEMLLPAAISVVLGLLIVFLGHFIFSRLPGINSADGTATAGLFGAVSASTLAAAIVMLEEQSMNFEAWMPALYPFMDIPALILAIVLASIQREKNKGGERKKVHAWAIVKESLRSSALSAMILGLFLGLFARPETVLASFYEPLFRGLLSVLMLVLGMEAWTRIKELKDVAHWFAVYAFFGPIVHGLIAFGLGYLAHLWVGFSPGGVVLLSVIAASNSDISGPPTIRAGIPWANPSSYIGASTSVGTPVAIAICIPLFVALAQVVFDL